MASTYTTDLAIQLMATGENAGTWGQITNTNLVVVQQAIAGYQDISIAGGAQTTALVMTQNALATARNAVIKLSGTITGNQIVTVPNGIEKTWIVSNGTSGAFTVQFKYASTGTGQTWSTTDKGIKILYADGTDIQVTDLSTLSGQIAAAQITTSTITQAKLAANSVGTNQLQTGAVTAVKITNSTITLNKLSATGTRDATTYLRGDNTFATVSGGGVAFETSLRTSSFTAVAGTGYLLDSTSATIDVTLPASPTTGAQITLVDATGGISSNPINILRNGNNIVGQARNTAIILARQGINIVYAGATQGWNLVGDFSPNSGTGNPINTYPIEFYMIGGGGGGGADDGGGGGGGGVRTGYFVGVKGNTYTITVGAGGASSATRGGDSLIIGTGTTVSAFGGGRGGGENDGQQGAQGGSGGGGGGYGAGSVGGQPIMPYTPFMNLNNYTSQGYIGGFTGGNHPSGNGGAAGGGGAGAVGVDCNNNEGSPGGAGAATTITGSSATYGGGGGGKGRGGNGGGGTGGGGNAQTAGQANTGGGGGGSGDQQVPAPSGGSGRVILKFPTSIAGTSTGSPTSGTTGGYTTLTWTCSGSYTA